jgi:alpha-glucosidase
LSWRHTTEDVLTFDRGPTFRCVVNLSLRPVDIRSEGRLLVSSEPCSGRLRPDTAAWLAPTA